MCTLLIFRAENIKPNNVLVNYRQENSRAADLRMSSWLISEVLFTKTLAMQEMEIPLGPRFSEVQKRIYR